MKRESPSIEYEEKIKCLNSIGVSNEIEHSQAFLQYTQSWLRKRNKGGLFMLNNDGYQFFKTVERHCRKYFQQKFIKGASDIRLPVINAVFRDKVALEHWKKATVGQDSVVSYQVMRMCIKLWINIRGHAFAMNYIEKFKNLQKAEASKKKALRKDLKSMKLIYVILAVRFNHIVFVLVTTVIRVYRSINPGYRIIVQLLYTKNPSSLVFTSDITVIV